MIRAALVLAATAPSALAQQGAPAPAPYAPLLFNPYANHWVFRAEGVPFLCVQDGRCARLRFERVGDEDLPAAGITSLGFADRVFYLAFQHPRHQDGRPHVFRCAADGCSKFELDPGDFTHLGSFAVKQRDRFAGKTAILAKHDSDPSRSRLLWCSDSGCSESAFTRENRYDLVFLGAARFEGRDRLWLREKSGAVLSCGQPEAEADRLDCERTSLAYPEFPDAGLDQRGLAAAIDEALKRGNLAEAERLLAEAQSRFPGVAQWGQFAQRLAQLRADRDARARTEQARRLVVDARRYANAGDFAGADALLQQAARLAPNLPELAAARTEVARLRAEREQRFRERAEYVTAIDRALAAYRLWEAESLIGEAERRFANDATFRNYRTRLAQLRAQAEWQRRLRQAREHIAAARQAIERGDFNQAERQLDEADEVAPGLPEIREARAELARERIDAEWRADEIRQLVAAIEAALARDRLELAERLLADATRRYPRHPAWNGLQRRIEQAKRAPDPGERDRERLAKARDLVAKARRSAAEGKFAEAERDLQEAQALAPTLPELAAARTEVARLKREAEEKGGVRKLVADARAALQRKDLAAAERAVVEAEKLAREAPEVKAVRADLDKAKREAADWEKAERVQKLVADARAALQRKDLAAAERAVSEAEKLDRDAPAVKAVRADLEAAKKAAPQPPRYDEAKLRAAYYDQIMNRLGPQLARYRAAPGNKAVAYCIDWSKVSATAVPQGPFAINTGPDPDAAVQARTLAACTQRAVPSCTCTLVDADGRNVLRVPAAVVERLNKTP